MLKSKFSKLVSINRNKMLDMEAKASKLEKELGETTRAREILEDNYFSLEIPQNGSFLEYRRAQELKYALSYEISTKKELEENLKIILESAKDELRVSLKEYEKSKYLDKLEIDKILKAKAIAEAKELDEISLMIYNNKQAFG